MEIWRMLHQILKDRRFWVVDDGPEKNWMEQYCEQHNMSRVTFFGYYDPTKYYKRASILHFTSAFEGFGNVLVEAQSYGCVPILFDSYAAASDIVNHTKDGFLVTPFNINEYIQQSISLANDFERLQNIAECAHQKAKLFSFEATYAKWQKLFSSA